MTDTLHATPAPLVTREALQQRYAWGNPVNRDAMDHGEVLHG